MNYVRTPCSTSSLMHWLNYITYINPKPIDLGLERILKVATKLNLIKLAPCVITVGGTNGKGTTCHLIETILLNNKISVGVYSSPHLLRYTERVRIQGKELTEKDHVKAMNIIESNRDDIKLSYFEFSTLLAFQLFKQSKLDVVILEVGLGGRLDATNIIDANIAVITSIAMDHVNFLGSTLEDIALEKSGIFRYGSPAIIGEPNRPIILDQEIAKYGAKLFAVNRDWWFCQEKNYWFWWDKYDSWTMLPIPNIPLNNAATALAVIRCLPFLISKITIDYSLLNTSLPARLQIINRKPLIIFDVAHNPHAIDYLANKVSNMNVQGQIRAIVGMRSDKDIYNSLKNINDLISCWYFTSLEGSDAAKSIQLANCINHNTIKLFDNVFHAWCQAIFDSSLEDCILVFGSFRTIAPIMNFLNKKNY